MAMDPILKNLIRVGKVTAIDTKKHQARVLFDDKPSTVSYWLDIIVRNTLRNKDYELPDIDEQVICLFLPNGNAQGFILGATYNTKDLPPIDDKDKRHVRFEDETEIEYDRKEHILTIKFVHPDGKINIIAPTNVNVIGDVIADGISLKHHIHVEPDGVTGEPVGGG